MHMALLPSESRATFCASLGFARYFYSHNSLSFCFTYSSLLKEVIEGTEMSKTHAQFKFMQIEFCVANELVNFSFRAD